MGNKKDFILSKANKGIRKKNRMLQIMIILLTCLAFYDSIENDIPLYYIFFYVVGLVVGRIFKYTRIVERDEEGQQLVLKTTKGDIVLSVALLLFRFVFGAMILQSAHVAFVSTALSLLFLGIYRSKWKGLVSQVDEMVYDWLGKEFKKKEQDS
ncbi:hypothetical protein [Algoriphagus sp.]|uniref:hypothetical protein n=1 Tax=Algoriphagus sp. TaxID=1872435 RepID=UPI0025EA6F87|nr:hypothetical protein [Algoriphagus sp.]